MPRERGKKSAIEATTAIIPVEDNKIYNIAVTIENTTCLVKEGVNERKSLLIPPY